VGDPCRRGPDERPGFGPKSTADGAPKNPAEEGMNTDGKVKRNPGIHREEMTGIGGERQKKKTGGWEIVEGTILDGPTVKSAAKKKGTARCRGKIQRRKNQGSRARELTPRGGSSRQKRHEKNFTR